MLNYPSMSDTVKIKAQAINLLILDVDGILSDGKLYFANSGEEIKTFHTQDGLGIKMLQNAGVQVAIITGRVSEIVKNRAESLGIEHIIQGRDDKLTAMNELLNKLQMSPRNTAYMGDDLPDLSAIIQANLGITVPNAHPLVKHHADWESTRNGGVGAVREACELIMAAQNKLESAWKKFL